jgi:hypothetical protein
MILQNKTSILPHSESCIKTGIPDDQPTVPWSVHGGRIYSTEGRSHELPIIKLFNLVFLLILLSSTFLNP